MKKTNNDTQTDELDFEPADPTPTASNPDAHRSSTPSSSPPKRGRRKGASAKAQPEISLESILWNCRNALRGTIGGNEKNRDAVMGLVFLKFIGDKFEKQHEKIRSQHEPEMVDMLAEEPALYAADNVFYLSFTSRWEYIVQQASANNIAVILDKAMADIEVRNPSLKGALPQNFYATLGTRKEQLKGLIDEINKIDAARFHEKDLIGRVYEYFLQVSPRRHPAG